MQVLGKTSDDQGYICLLSEEEIQFYLNQPEKLPESPPPFPVPIREMGLSGNETTRTITFDCASMDAVAWLTANCRPEWGELYAAQDKQLVLRVRMTYDMEQIGSYLVHSFYSKKGLGTWADGLEEINP